MTDEPPTLWDQAEGERRRDVGMATVTENAGEKYREEFEAVVRGFYERRVPFTSEDVTAKIGPPPSHPNAIGALTRAVALRFGAVKLDRVKAQRAVRHAGEIARWGWPLP